MSAASEVSDLCNGSQTHLERQGKHHHRLASVTLPLPLPLSLDVPLDVPLDASLDARCGYALNVGVVSPQELFSLMDPTTITLVENSRKSVNVN